MESSLGVLMVTGAYYPEIGGGGATQCRGVIRSLKNQLQFTVLTTCVDPRLPRQSDVENVPVYRVPVNIRRFWSKALAAIRLSSLFIRLRRRFDVVHFHGFSQKVTVLTVLAKVFKKRLVTTMHAAGLDEPQAVRTKGRMGYACYAKSDLFIGVSQQQRESFRSSGLPLDRLMVIPNGVDVERFRPGTKEERIVLRRDLGLPTSSWVILFVGFFSREKCPQVLFEAWTRLQEEGLLPTTLLFVGATHSQHYEVDPQLADGMRREARARGLADHIVFIEKTLDIEACYRAADCFAMPSTREGLPVSLLEAMASGLACVVSRLPGVTDTIIQDGVDGLLVEPGDARALEGGLRRVLQQSALKDALGAAARQTVAKRFSIEQTAQLHLEAYRRVMGLADGRSRAHGRVWKEEMWQGIDQRNA